MFKLEIRNKFNLIDILNGKIPYPYLIEQLLEYGNKMDKKFYEGKVFKVWMKCKKAKKYNLADKIRNKYPKCFEIKSDMAQAFALSIATSNKLKNEQIIRNLQ